MASRLNPYISFAGNAREAMEFYQGVFGGELTMNTFGEYGRAGRPRVADKIMHAQLETDRRLHADGRRHAARAWSTTRATTSSVSLSGEDADELRGYWDKLSGGGTVDDAAGEADVGRRVRHVHRPVRHRVDGEHRAAPLAIEPGLDSPSPHRGVRMAQVIDGDALAARLHAEIEEEVSVLRLSSVRPDWRRWSPATTRARSGTNATSAACPRSWTTGTRASGSTTQPRSTT